jgi:hypothetical protein
VGVVKTQAEWGAEIFQVAQELGYGIQVIAPKRVRLIPWDDHSATVTIESVLISGPYLREILTPRKPRK